MWMTKNEFLYLFVPGFGLGTIFGMFVIAAAVT